MGSSISAPYIYNLQYFSTQILFCKHHHLLAFDLRDPDFMRVFRVRVDSTNYRYSCYYSMTIIATSITEAVGTFTWKIALREHYDKL